MPISIHNKQYFTVAERLQQAHEKKDFLECLTEVLQYEPQVVIKATIKTKIGTFTGISGADANKQIEARTPFEVAECVPLDTKILTKNGFVFYHQLTIGEDILTVSPITGKQNWQKLEKVSVYENQPVVRILSKKFNAICTPDHKWITETQDGIRSLEKLNDINFNSNKKIILVGKKPSQLDQDAARLGWLFSDGLVKYTKNGLPTTSYVRQSKEQHFEHLELLFGKNYREIKYEKWMDSREWVVSATETRRILGIFKVSTYKDLPKAVSNMSAEQAESYFRAMMAADGSGREFYKTYYEIVESMQIAGQLCGIRTGAIKERWMKNSTKPLFTLPIYKTNGAFVSSLELEFLPPTTVWCPTVKNGTWVAKQDEQAWVTGNTSAVGRALAFAGYAGTEIASAEEMQKAFSSDTPIVTKPVSGLSMPCRIHKVEMRESISKKTGNPYFSHRLEDGSLCFGK